MPGSGVPTTIGAINAKQLVKVCAALLVLLLFTGDASAFGKRGPGLFGRRAESGSSCGTASASAVGLQTSNSCASGDCGTATGNSSFAPSFGPQTAYYGTGARGLYGEVWQLAPGGGVQLAPGQPEMKRWVDAYGREMVCDANGCRPAARAAPVAGVNCPCVAANGYCPCASAMNQKSGASRNPAEIDPPKTIRAYGRTYTLQP